MVEPLVATRERITALWTQLQPFPALRAQLDMLTPEGLLRALEQRRNVFLEVADGTAMVIATDVHPGDDANVFFVAWDEQLRGKEEAFREALRYLFQLASLRRVTMATPDDMRVLMKLAWRLGVRWEGVLRQGWVLNGHGGDVHLHGMLRTELLAGDRTEPCPVT